MNMPLSTEQVLPNHLQAIGSGGMEALLAVYSEESVLIFFNGSLTGLTEIHREFANLLTALPPGATFSLVSL